MSRPMFARLWLSLAEKQYKKYEHSDARTEYVVFPGRPHLMMVAEGWEEIAGRIESWLDAVETGHDSAP